MLKLFVLLVLATFVLYFYNPSVVENLDNVTQTGDNQEEDVNACLAVVKEFDKMVKENRSQYESKLEEWQKKRDALKGEFELGKQKSISRRAGIGNRSGTRDFSLSCNAKDDWIIGIGGESSKVQDNLYVICKKGGQHEASEKCRGNCKSFLGKCNSGFNNMNANYNQKGINFIQASGTNCRASSQRDRSYNQGSISYSCPPGTVLKTIRGKTGPWEGYTIIREIEYECEPPGYQPGNWKDLDHYYESKTNDKKPPFQPIPVGSLPCQNCINKAANVDVTDSRKVEIVQQCANQLKEKALDKAAATQQAEIVKEIDDKIESDKEDDKQQVNNTTAAAAGIGGTISCAFICILLIVIAVMGFMLMRKR